MEMLVLVGATIVVPGDYWRHGFEILQICYTKNYPYSIVRTVRIFVEVVTQEGYAFFGDARYKV